MTKVKINNIEYFVSEHAKYRMQKRKVKMHDIVEAMENINFKRRNTKEGCDERIMVVGKNKVTVVYEEKTNVIITVYNYRKQYYVSKSKAKKNKEKRKLKKELGNRFKA